MSECTKCPAGYYCLSTNDSNQIPCGPNYYCPAGSSYPRLCPDGTYSKAGDVKFVNASQCRNCITGSYCRSGKIFGPCAGGYYCKSRSPDPNPSGNYSHQVEAGPCAAGFYCPNGTLNPIPCPNNTFKGYEGGNGLISDCKPCPAGKQCFKGEYSSKIEDFIQGLYKILYSIDCLVFLQNIFYYLTVYKRKNSVVNCKDADNCDGLF